MEGSRLFRFYLVSGEKPGVEMFRLHRDMRDIGGEPSAGGDPDTNESLWFYHMGRNTRLEVVEAIADKYPFVDGVVEGNFPK